MMRKIVFGLVLAGCAAAATMAYALTCPPPIAMRRLYTTNGDLTDLCLSFDEQTVAVAPCEARFASDDEVFDR